MLIHIVTAGETLFSIAKEYDADPNVLSFDNDISDPTKLPIGMPIAIVRPITVHTVSSGETLYSVSGQSSC